MNTKKTSLKVLGVLVFIFGFYLFATSNHFFGILAIAAAFFIFPSGKREQKDDGPDFDNDFDFGDSD